MAHVFTGRRARGILAGTVGFGLVVGVVAAPGAAAADNKIKLPKVVEATAGFSVTLPIKVTGKPAELQVDWGNDESSNTYTNECSYSSQNPSGVCSGTAQHTFYAPGDYTVTINGQARDFAEDGTSSSTPLAPATTTVRVGGKPVAKPFYAGNVASIQVSDVPRVVATPTPFTVVASREDAVPACSAEFGGIEIEGPGPWNFTYDLAVGGREVRVKFCDAGYAGEYLRVQPLFEFNGPELINLTGEWSSKKQDARWTVRSASDAPATIEVLRKGEVLGSAALPPGDSAELAETFRAKDFPVGSTELTVRATDANGSAMQWPITLAKGWAGFDNKIDPTFTPCSTVSWSYNKKGAPKSTSKMTKTLRQSFAKLEKTTGLNFVEAKPGDATADVRIGWGDLRHRGYNVAGIGGTDGQIVLSTTSSWPRDSHAGLTKNTGRGIPGNGWLVIHEALHVLGFDHTDSHGELMSSQNYRDLAGFGKGDLAAINAFYKPGQCG